MGDTSGGKEGSFEAPYKLFGIGKSLTSKNKKIIFNVYCYLAILDQSRLARSSCGRLFWLERERSLEPLIQGTT